MTTPDGFGASLTSLENAPVRIGCRVVDLADPTPHIRIVRLASVSGRILRFAAGQYAAVSFGTSPARHYAMANRPDQPVLEFHIEHSRGDGAVAHVVRELRLGDIVWVEGPYGDAWLRREHSGPMLAVAGGSGLGSIKSIVETALSLGMRQPIHLFSGARDEDDVYLEDCFRRLAGRYPNFHYVVVLSDPARPTARPVRSVAKAAVEAFPSFDGFKAYLAGPPAMVEAAAAMLVERGLPPSDVHANRFSNSRARRAHAALG